MVVALNDVVGGNVREVVVCVVSVVSHGADPGGCVAEVLGA